MIVVARWGPVDGEPALVLDEAVVPWTIRGYSAARARPRAGFAEVIPPPSTLAALRAGYRPQIDRRLELQNLDAELPAALTIMGVLDVVGVPVRAYAAGQLGGPALGVLASCDQRRAYPNAGFMLAEPEMTCDGTATEVAAQEERLRVMVDELYVRLAEVTGREIGQIRDDARRNRFLTVEQAITYGLIQSSATDR